MLTWIAGNAETCYNFDAHVDVNADEERHGTSCYFIYAYAYANETG